jgi:hypothetical protein
LQQLEKWSITKDRIEVASQIILLWCNRMASKCEQAWHSCQQDKPIHVPSHSKVNDLSSPRLLGIEAVSWLSSVRTEWQANVSKRDIHTNKINQSTYWATEQSTTLVLRVHSEWNPRVDYNLMEQWQGNVSKRDIHTNKINQSTYRATI